MEARIVSKPRGTVSDNAAGELDALRTALYPGVVSYQTAGMCYISALLDSPALEQWLSVAPSVDPAYSGYLMLEYTLGVANQSSESSYLLCDMPPESAEVLAMMNLSALAGSVDPSMLARLDKLAATKRFLANVFWAFARQYRRQPSGALANSLIETLRRLKDAKLAGEKLTHRCWAQALESECARRIEKIKRLYFPLFQLGGYMQPAYTEQMQKDIQDMEGEFTACLKALEALENRSVRWIFVI